MDVRVQAVEIAKKAAKEHGTEGYTKVEDFQPHEWVIQAIMAGMGAGYNQCLLSVLDTGM